ncbi:MAG: hypothetical protein P8076_10990 [Gammaproteobacteria bacterium]
MKDFVESASEGAGTNNPFWHSDSAEAREEGMYQLAFELDVADKEALLRKLPDGYAAVHWIFTWEQSRAGEGFCTGIENSGVTAVENAACWYVHLGMAEEADGLKAMLSQYAKTPENHELVEAGYDSVENPYREDWDRIPRVVEALCDRAEELFYEQP